MRASTLAALSAAALALTVAQPRVAVAQQNSQGSGGTGSGASSADFDAGFEAFTARRYADALELFTRAHRQSGSPNAMLYIARSLERLGRIPEAVTAYDTTARDAAARASSEPRYAPTRDAATAAVTRLHDRVASVRLRLASPPADLVVRVGDRVIDRAAWDGLVYVEPGTVHVTAEAAGYERFETTVAMAPGATAAVDLAVRRASGRGGASAAAGAQGSRANGPVDDAGDAHALRVPAGLALGVGVIGFAAAAVFHTLADQQYNALSQCADHPGSSACPDSITGAFQAGRTYETATNVGLAVGGVGVALGAVLLLVDVTSSHGGRQVAVGAGPGTLYVRGTF